MNCLTSKIDARVDEELPHIRIDVGVDELPHIKIDARVDEELPHIKIDATVDEELQ